MDAGLAALRSIGKAMRQLARVPSQVAPGASESIRGLIVGKFATGTDPYGNPWAPHLASTTERWGAHPLLDLTGDLKDVEVSPAAGSGISVTLGADYGAFHQIGTRYMTARPILPTHGLPDAWSRAIADESERLFDEAVR